MGKRYSPLQVLNLFRSNKSRQQLYKDEASGLIPTAKRTTGKVKARYWETEDLPGIGKHYGFLKPQTKSGPIVIAVHMRKGGVLKTTTTYNLGRILAINNLNTLIVPVEEQNSSTNILTPIHDIESVHQIPHVPGLYEVSTGERMIKDVVLPTDLPSMHYIPESPKLTLLDEKIRNEVKREFYIKKLIEPIMNDYDVIIFDTSSFPSMLTLNALAAANNVVSPIACNIQTFTALTDTLNLINSFRETLELDWDNFLFIPTLLENNKLSSEILVEYKEMFGKNLTNREIRKSVKGDEAIVEKLSVIEYDHSSPLADDYYNVITDIWNRVN